MPPHSISTGMSIWAAVQQALNLSGVGALIAGLFLITKSKSDANLILAQMQQRIESDERNADQVDIKIVSDQRIAAASEVEKVILAIKEQRDYWQGLCKIATNELDMRNQKLAEHGTNYAEMFALMDVPGAMDALRAHRNTFTTVTTTTIRTETTL